MNCGRVAVWPRSTWIESASLKVPTSNFQQPRNACALLLCCSVCARPTPENRSKAIPTTRTLRLHTVCLRKTFLCLPNALVQLQARYNHCDEVASETCLSAATFVR